MSVMSWRLIPFTDPKLTQPRPTVRRWRRRVLHLSNGSAVFHETPPVHPASPLLRAIISAERVSERSSGHADGRRSSEQSDPDPSPVGARIVPFLTPRKRRRPGPGPRADWMGYLGQDQGAEGAVRLRGVRAELGGGSGRSTTDARGKGKGRGARRPRGGWSSGRVRVGRDRL